MVKGKGSIWKFFKEKGTGVICNYCGKEYKTKHSTKMTNHIKSCFKCPEELRRKLIQNSDVKQNDLSTCSRTSTPNPSTYKASVSDQALAPLEIDLSLDESLIKPSCSSSKISGSQHRLSGEFESSATSMMRASRSSSQTSLMSFVDTMDEETNVCIFIFPFLLVCSTVYIELSTLYINVSQLFIFPLFWGDSFVHRVIHSSFSMKF